MLELSEFVTLSDTTLTTDSRRVAKHFKKLHKSVLRAYDNMKIEDDYRKRNFAPTIYEVPGPKGSTRQERVIQMTKDGFVLLVMGFTGQQAMQIKIDYITAFNSMAEQLQQISMSYFRNLWDQRLELEKLDATTFMWASFGAKRMVERKRELPGIKSSRARLEEKMQPQLFAVPKDVIAI